MVVRTAFGFVAELVVVIMCRYDKDNCRYQKPVFYTVKKLFQEQENKPGCKNQHRTKRMMMFDIAMKKRIASHCKSNSNHRPFKSEVVNDINTKQRQTRKYQRQKSAMYGAGHRSSNANDIPIKLYFHRNELQM